jgi:hypothetical protein
MALVPSLSTNSNYLVCSTVEVWRTGWTSLPQLNRILVSTKSKYVRIVSKTELAAHPVHRMDADGHLVLG